MRGSAVVTAHPEAAACAGSRTGVKPWGLGSSRSPGLCLGGALVVFGCLVVVVRMTSQKLLSEGRGKKKETKLTLPSQMCIRTSAGRGTWGCREPGAALVQRSGRPTASAAPDTGGTPHPSVPQGCSSPWCGWRAPSQGSPVPGHVSAGLEFEKGTSRADGKSPLNTLPMGRPLPPADGGSATARAAPCHPWQLPLARRSGTRCRRKHT